MWFLFQIYQIYRLNYQCFYSDVVSLLIQSVRPVTTEVEAPVPCAPEMRSNQHQVTLLTVQLTHHVMAALTYQMIITHLVVGEYTCYS